MRVLSRTPKPSPSAPRQHWQAAKAWKGHAWEVLDRLHAKSYISDSKSKAKSVWMSDEGTQRARELFERHFALKF
jgi:hypothetical protein